MFIFVFVLLVLIILFLSIEEEEKRLKTVSKETEEFRICKKEPYEIYCIERLYVCAYFFKFWIPITGELTDLEYVKNIFKKFKEESVMTKAKWKQIEIKGV